jgi:hypothetical protein
MVFAWVSGLFCFVFVLVMCLGDGGNDGTRQSAVLLFVMDGDANAHFLLFPFLPFVDDGRTEGPWGGRITGYAQTKL